MIQTIENEELIVKIDTVGAELASIWSKKDNKEYLWQGDPKIWASQAPVLFPIVGGLKNGTYTHKGKSYSLPKHGFIRYNKNLMAVQHKDTEVTFTLHSSEETLKAYPFHFEFTISFELVDNQIKLIHTVKNTGHEMMYFSLGGHPAFNCPLHPTEKYDEYYIQLEKAATTACYALDSDGLIGQNTISVIKDSKIHLHDTIFNNDALIFKNIKTQKATLMHQKRGAIIAMEFPDFPDLGVWAKPKARYVCIEPWLGYADIAETTQKLAEKEGIQQLDKKQSHISNYSIIISAMNS